MEMYVEIYNSVGKQLSIVVVKLKVYTSLDPAVPLLSIYPRGTDPHTSVEMFT